MKGMLLVFLATLGLGVRFNIPKNCLLVSSVIASLSIGIVDLMKSLGATNSESAFVGAFLVAMSAELLARVMKVPSPVLSIPGVIPLVPGSMAYRAVIHLVKGEEVEGVGAGTRVLITAVGIASGLLLASAISRKVLRPVFWSNMVPYKALAPTGIEQAPGEATTASGDESCSVCADAAPPGPDQTEISPPRRSGSADSSETPG